MNFWVIKVLTYLLLVSITRPGLIKNLHVLINALGKVRLKINASKYKFLCFNPSPPVHVGIMLLKSNSKTKWLGITFSATLLATCLSLVASPL